MALLTTKQVCDLLGVSYPTVDKFRRYKECPLPYGRAGRSYFYEEDLVRQWLQDNALLDPGRPVREKLDHERNAAVVATPRGA